jgi:hypothetical protein
VSDSVLAKVVITVVVLIAFAVWRSSEHIQQPNCGNNCPTDLSASRK